MDGWVVLSGLWTYRMDGKLNGNEDNTRSQTNKIWVKSQALTMVCFFYIKENVYMFMLLFAFAFILDLIHTK